jgi:copper homeostasis protein
MEKTSIAVELCVESVPSAIAAERGGATRLELCADLLEGGITPSLGMIELVREKTTIGLQVMIRPHGGDFCYSDEEFEIMLRDILAVKKIGADGVVFGILQSDGNVDVARSRLLVELARPLNVTFHRAFDVSADLSRTLEDVCSAGADRILTSGREQSADEGAPEIKRSVEQARGRIAIMACGGIRAHNAATILEKTGVKEIHTALRTPIGCAMRNQNARISVGTVMGLECQRFEVREEDVQELCRAVTLARV